MVFGCLRGEETVFPTAPLGDVTQPVERKLIRRYDDLVTNFGFLQGRTGG